ncbi:multidrug efflux SMR transporter [Paenibacillus sp. SYP-B3998]|uniref:Multidrug efflux SMR transporter n=1 Tax=Paenibacillus sp. SYP-B3998 TaxID=2678564 RepID=A0A6G3ZUW2_9BACL|nr:multidrug efflux SMR transporter [Paenibacillus sp. SYP-B3998]NEW05484.1 multidrug efflux SMR transporter [Paenibacillus sp. SYP-B3998]
MSSYIFLFTSIFCEAFASAMMKASKGYSRVLPTICMISGYAAAFYFLSLAVRNIPLSFAYATWAGLGTVLVAIIGRFAFKETISKKSVLGMTMLVVGVVLLNLSGSSH